MLVIDVGTDALDRYRAMRLQEGAAKATINREIALLRRMFRIGHYSTPQKVTSLPKSLTSKRITPAKVFWSQRSSGAW